MSSIAESWVTQRPDDLPPGVHKITVTFDHPLLADWQWPTVEIIGQQPGRRLAIWAGIHVNEVSSIEAARRLTELFDPSTLRGRISIMPIVNLPALPERTKLECPVDGRNINFCFPGSVDGTFSEVLAHHVRSVWAYGAWCIVDLHGGDMSESVTHFTVRQLTGDPEYDAQAAAVSACFQPDIAVELPVEAIDAPGRSCTAAARERRLAAFAEAGNGGQLDESDVTFHVDGVIRLAALGGLIEPTLDVTADRQAHRVSRYEWLSSPVTGWGQVHVKPGDVVQAGQAFANVSDYHTNRVTTVNAPADGVIIWTDSHPAVEEGQFLGAVGSL